MTRGFLLFLLIVLLNYCREVYTLNSYYIVAILRNHTDGNYDEVSEKIQEKIDELVNDRMNDIYEVIENNRETYTLNNGEIDKKLDELNSSPLRKRNDRNDWDKADHEFGKTKKYLFINKNRPSRIFKRSLEQKDNSVIGHDHFNSTHSAVEYIPFESDLVGHICPVSNYYTIRVYLSDETAKIVCRLENVLYCEPSSPLKLLGKDETYYDIEAIKKETQWHEVSVQSFNYPGQSNYLSLISQSMNVPSQGTPDENFYYPSSAGQGVDIYLIDEGLIVDHEDYDTYEGTPYERTISCDAIIKDNQITLTSEEEKKACWNSITDIPNYPDHGIGVTSLSGGTIFGVAKKANLHMIATELISYDILQCFDFISQHAQPHKTVISMSIGGGKYKQAENDKINDLIAKGFILLVAAGNESTDACNKRGNSYNYGGYSGTISVGAVDSRLVNNKYLFADYSNYGDCIDIFAPGNVIYPIIGSNGSNGSSGSSGSNSTTLQNVRGTSFSTPLVAGVAASIISEHPEIKFDQEIMRKTLIDMSTKEAIIGLESLDTPNRFINNGKKSNYVAGSANYSGECGSGNHRKCTDGCCSKEGRCIRFNDPAVEKCLIKNGCQSDYGYCTTSEQSVEECENELREHEECQMDIARLSYQNKELLYESCQRFHSEKCKNFYQNMITGKTVCSLAKKYKSFNLMDLSQHRNYHTICHRYYNDQCQSKLNKCKVDESMLDDFESLKNKCQQFQSGECQEFFKNGINNSSICSLIDPKVIKTRPEASELNRLKMTGDSICKNVSENPDFPTENCNNYIKQYDECQLDVTSISNDEERLTEKCIQFKSKKCQDFYESFREEVPAICSHVESPTTLMKSMAERFTAIDNVCSGLNEKIETTVSSQCEKELQVYERCLIDYSPQMNETEFYHRCSIFNSDQCNRFYSKTIDKEISSCSNSVHINTFSISKKRDQFKNAAKKIYDKLCNNDKDYIIQKCYSDLRIPNKCQFEFPFGTLKDNQIIEKCIEFSRCQEDFDRIKQIKEFTPICSAAQYYEIFEMIETKNESVMTFCQEFMVQHKQQIIANCENERQPFKSCPREFHPRMEEEEITKNCQIFKSKNCFYEDGRINNNHYCDYAKKYNFMEFMDHSPTANYYKLLCGSNRKTLELNCENKLKPYHECLFDGPATEEQCQSFLSTKCQEFYSNQNDLIPECYVVGRYEKQDILSKNDLKWEAYNNECHP